MLFGISITNTNLKKNYLADIFFLYKRSVCISSFIYLFFRLITYFNTTINQTFDFIKNFMCVWDVSFCGSPFFQIQTGLKLFRIVFGNCTLNP